MCNKFYYNTFLNLLQILIVLFFAILELYMNKNIVIVGVAIIIASIAGFFIFKPSGMNDGQHIDEPMDVVTETEDIPQGTSGEEPKQNEDVLNVSTTTTTSVSVSTTKVFTVSAGNYYFAPSVMKVKKGDTVKITVNNSGGMHDLKIDAFEAATKKLKSGESETITFVADEIGTFDYYCSIGDHRLMGMVGKLIVE